jgi:hypothetical protein
MAAKKTGRRAGKLASGQDAMPAMPDVVKVTLRISSQTAKRLAIASVMTSESQSSIAERVLSAHLSGWRLPNRVGGPVAAPVESAGDAA